jgi:hypothetical protein
MAAAHAAGPAGDWTELTKIPFRHAASDFESGFRKGISKYRAKHPD